MSNPRNPYYASKGLGSGIKDDQLHYNSGGRTRQMTCLLANNPAMFVEGTSDTVNASDWTELALDDIHENRLPFPCTPAITYVQGGSTPWGGTQVVEIRITGYDVYGTLVRSEEFSMTCGSHTQDGASITWCPQPFTIITKIEYKLQNADAGDRLHVGVMWQLDFSKDVAIAGGFITADNAEYIGTGRQGIALPADFNYVSASSTPGNWPTVVPAKAFEITNVQIRNIDALGTLDTATLQPVGTLGGFTFGAAGGASEPNYPKNRLWILATALLAGGLPIPSDRPSPNTWVIPSALTSLYDIGTSSDRHLLTITYRAAGKKMNAIDGSQYPEQF